MHVNDGHTTGLRPVQMLSSALMNISYIISIVTIEIDYMNN